MKSCCLASIRLDALRHISGKIAKSADKFNVFCIFLSSQFRHKPWFRQMSGFVFYEDAESIIRAFSDQDVESDILKLKTLLRKVGICVYRAIIGCVLLNIVYMV